LLLAAKFELLEALHETWKMLQNGLNVQSERDTRFDLLVAVNALQKETFVHRTGVTKQFSRPTENSKTRPDNGVAKNP
jgi:hypothetical protein